jgi:uncharacterized protein (DUF1501 family)
MGQAGCAALGSTTLLSTLLNIRTMDAMTEQNSSLSNCSDFKAMVCLFNGGGMDSFNMLIPTTPAEFANYTSVRSNNALSLNGPNSIRPISVLNTPGRTFGLHPALVNIQSLFNSGDAAFVANIGSLVAPMTKQEYYDGTVVAPLGLYSHSDQQMHWMTGFASKRDSVGWAGRMGDLLSSCNTQVNIPMNISFSGSNILQTGNENVEYSINPWNPTVGINSDEINPWSNWFDYLKKDAMTNIVDQTYANIFENTFKNTIKKARLGNADVTAAIGNAPTFSGVFSSNYISDSFKVIAQLIATQAQLGMQRQIYFIDYGGWDHHDELLNNQNELFIELDTAIAEFKNALTQINKWDNVVTFNLSEFSRTLTSNGNGTDHAWGGNVFAIGGPVVGTKIYGEYPESLSQNGPLEIGGGVFIPTTAAEEYFAELAMWFGVPPSSLVDLFPNLPNFYSVGNTKPIGFLNY